VPAEAGLVRRDGKMVFVDPALESKPEMSKQLYRAGQPSVDAARQAATAWLSAIKAKTDDVGRVSGLPTAEICGRV
jgi:hypothetical protein